ncbi:MAG: hypothetical protein M1818_007502 [Claussenomyces sp. TS43310]|nr:MAG: hypothetical protein M1818_007502 [Claussenomyces sp. TS43310]
MSSASDTPPIDYDFNAPLSAVPNNSDERRRSPNSNDALATNGGDGDYGAPKAKRIACIICRKRKLKCDGSKPSCSTCTRLGHSCAYDEVRRKSGPKRGYVKALEERLKQVETLLKTQDPVEKPSEPPAARFAVNNRQNSSSLLQPSNPDFDVTNPNISFVAEGDAERWNVPTTSPQVLPMMDDMAFDASMDMGMTMDEANFSWEMIGLGLDEPLPPQETIDELHQIYFDKIHPSIPMIHKYRYSAAMNLAPSQRPPVCLRYAMWTLASSITEKYMNLKDHFYQRSRKYVEQDYLKGHGEHIISVAHAQAHILLASYEFKMMYFPRAWMSTGAAVRLSQMMGLHRLDGIGLDVKQCLPGPRDSTEREERRRTFWMAFCEDRYASIGTGWPMTIEERDILTNLPASEEAFENSREERTQTLSESLDPSGASSLSPFGGVVLMACLFGRNLVHLHRPDKEDRDNDLNGEFWKRHRHMDNILLNTSLSLPAHLKLPQGLSNPNIVFTNMNIHTSTICLHQAAIYKADKNRLPALMNPFMSFCLYVSARVFVQYLKSRPEDDSIAHTLKFLLTAMNAMKSKNPLTESFLVQLDVDLESLGLKNPKFKTFTYGPQGSDVGSKSPVPPGPMFGRPMQLGSVGGGGQVGQCKNMEILVMDSEVEANEEPISNQYSGTNILDPGLSAMPQSTGFSTGFEEPMSWASLTDFTHVHGAGMQGIAPGVENMPRHLSGYNASDSTSNTHDIEFSENPSDRPTPTSSIQSDMIPNSNLQLGQKASQNGHSGRSSFETSPGSSHAQGPDGQAPQITDQGFWAHAGANFSGIGQGVAVTPGRDYAAGNGWEMGQGLTPVGEGVFRDLMGMGQIDSLNWEGAPS